MIRARGLGATTGEGVAVRGVELDLPGGTVYGLLGHAAGDRSLLLQLLGAIRPPDRGTATVLGLDVEREAVEVRRRAAFLPREKDAYLNLDAGEFLHFYLGFFPGASPPDAALSRAGVDPGLRLADASPAQRTRVLLAAVLARDAELLLIDEPTADLDPAAAESVLAELVAGAGPGGRGIVLVSSRIDDVQRICDRVGIMVDGRLVLDDGLDALLERWRRVRVGGDLRAAHELGDLPGTRAVCNGPGGIELVTDDYAGLSSKLSGQSGTRVQPMSLREIYVEVVSRVA